MFDFNKLDDYKVALDDGFRFDEWISDDVHLEVGKLLKDYQFIHEDERFYTNLKIEDWERFKKEVTDFLLNGVVK